MARRKDMMLSDYVSYTDATKSITAIRNNIRNTPTAADLERMKLTAVHIYDKLCVQFGWLTISSFFRAPALNKLVGGAKNSSHLRGEAIDIDGTEDGQSNLKILTWARENLDFDQIIHEFGTKNNPAWVHISYRAKGNRREVLRAIKVNGSTQYVKIG